jgi:hypothetical protein
MKRHLTYPVPPNRYPPPRPADLYRLISPSTDRVVAVNALPRVAMNYIRAANLFGTLH